MYSSSVKRQAASVAYAGCSVTCWSGMGHSRTFGSYDLDVYLIKGGLHTCILHTQRWPRRLPEVIPNENTLILTPRVITFVRTPKGVIH